MGRERFDETEAQQGIREANVGREGPPGGGTEGDGFGDTKVELKKTTRERLFRGVGETRKAGSEGVDLEEEI